VATCLLRISNKIARVTGTSASVAVTLIEELPYSATASADAFMCLQPGRGRRIFGLICRSPGERWG
jgi:hypothetical protein